MADAAELSVQQKPEALQTSAPSENSPSSGQEVSRQGGENLVNFVEEIKKRTPPGESPSDEFFHEFGEKGQPPNETLTTPGTPSREESPKQSQSTEEPPDWLKRPSSQQSTESTTHGAKEESVPDNADFLDYAQIRDHLAKKDPGNQNLGELTRVAAATLSEYQAAAQLNPNLTVEDFLNNREISTTNASSTISAEKSTTQHDSEENEEIVDGEYTEESAPDFDDDRVFDYSDIFEYFEKQHPEFKISEISNLATAALRDYLDEQRLNPNLTVEDFLNNRDSSTINASSTASAEEPSSSEPAASAENTGNTRERQIPQPEDATPSDHSQQERTGSANTGNRRAEPRFPNMKESKNNAREDDSMYAFQLTEQMLDSLGKMPEFSTIYKNIMSDTSIPKEERLRQFESYIRDAYRRVAEQTISGSRPEKAFRDEVAKDKSLYEAISKAYFYKVALQPHARNELPKGVNKKDSRAELLMRQYGTKILGEYLLVKALEKAAPEQAKEISEQLKKIDPKTLPDRKDRTAVKHLPRALRLFMGGNKNYFKLVLQLFAALGLAIPADMMKELGLTA